MKSHVLYQAGISHSYRGCFLNLSFNSQVKWLLPTENNGIAVVALTMCSQLCLVVLV